MQTQDEEMATADIENLKRLAGGLIIEYLHISGSIFPQSNYSKESLMEGHFRREVFFQCTDHINLIDLWQFDDIDMPHNEEGIEDVLVDLDPLQPQVCHALHLVALKPAQDIVTVFETSEQHLSHVRKILDVYGSTSAVLGLALVVDLACKLLLTLIGRKDVCEEDVSVWADEVHLASCYFFINRPLSDESYVILRPDGEEQLAVIVEDSDFLLNPDKNAHLC